MQYSSFTSPMLKETFHEGAAVADPKANEVALSLVGGMA